jgi:hypothetical protein
VLDCRAALLKFPSLAAPPMRILTRYVLFDLLKVFCLTLTGLTLLIVVVLIGKEAVEKGIGLGPLLRMTPYLLPQAMQFAVPGTMLMATTSVYGRMASYNEIVAIKSLGISPMAIVWPTLVLATLVSFVAVVLNDLAVSWGRLGVQRVFLASIEEVTYGQLRTRRPADGDGGRRPDGDDPSDLDRHAADPADWQPDDYAGPRANPEHLRVAAQTAGAVDEREPATSQCPVFTLACVVTGNETTWLAISRMLRE